MQKLATPVSVFGLFPLPSERLGKRHYLLSRPEIRVVSMLIRRQGLGQRLHGLVVLLRRVSDDLSWEAKALIGHTLGGGVHRLAVHRPELLPILGRHPRRPPPHWVGASR